ncbi:MAG: aromatic acid exporter family protein [Kineosporiaceae bacterium]
MSGRPGPPRGVAGWLLWWLRSGLRPAVGRVRMSLWAVAQMSAGAGLAWWIATELVGHPFPFFAAVAAVVCLGLAAAHRLRRVAELAVGVTVGVALGEALVDVIGRGAWQIALVVALALALSRLLDSGALLATQAAVQAVLVLAIPEQASGNVDRWVDAMVGGLVALAIALLTPPDPRYAADAGARSAILALVRVLRCLATAVRDADPDEAGRALGLSRATQRDLDEWEAAVATGEEIVRFSPLRRHRARDMVHRRRALTGLDRAVRNARVLARRVAGALDDGRPVPVPVAAVLDDLATALERLRGPVGAGEAGSLVADLTDLARRLRVAETGSTSWAGAVAVAQLRSIVVDVLTATGMPARQARALLPDPGRAIG